MIRTSLTIVLLACVCTGAGCGADATQAAPEAAAETEAGHAVRALTRAERASRPPEVERPDSDAAKAVRDLRDLLAQANFANLYDQFDRSSQQRLDGILLAMRSRDDGGLETTADVLADLMSQARAWGWRSAGLIDRVVEDDVRGDYAVVRVSYEEGGARTYELTREGGVWRVNIEPLLAGIEQMTEAILLNRLHSLRIKCDQYAVAHGRAPDFAGTQWEALIDAGFVRDAPRNPHARAPVSALVVVVDETGVTGEAVDPMDGGWVWNAADQMLYATGRGGFD